MRESFAAVETILTLPAGTLEVDYKERLITYMVENGLNNSRDIHWMKLTRLSMFKGTTRDRISSLDKSPLQGQPVSTCSTSVSLP